MASCERQVRTHPTIKNKKLDANLSDRFLISSPPRVIDVHAFGRGRKKAHKLNLWPTMARSGPLS